MLLKINSFDFFRLCVYWGIVYIYNHMKFAILGYMNDRQAELLIEALRESNRILESKLEQLDRSLDKIQEEIREINR